MTQHARQSRTFTSVEASNGTVMSSNYHLCPLFTCYFLDLISLQLPSTCYQPWQCQRDGSHHQNCSCWECNCHLGVRSHLGRQRHFRGSLDVIAAIRMLTIKVFNTSTSSRPTVNIRTLDSSIWAADWILPQLNTSTASSSVVECLKPWRFLCIATSDGEQCFKCSTRLLWNSFMWLD